MKAWDRFQKTVERKSVDHVPIALIGTSRFYASIAKASLSDILFNPQRLIEVQKKAFDLFPDITFIPGAWPDLGVATLSAYGCKVYWLPDGMPQIRNEIIKSESDLTSLVIPNPKTDGFMPLYLNTLRLFLEQEEIFLDALRFTWSIGPGEMASYFCGITNFFIALVNDKKLVFGVLEKATKGIITWINAQLEINPHAVGILLTDDIAGMISKKHYEEFIFPFHRRIREEFPDLLIVFHNDTKSDHILQSIADTGFDVFNFGKTTDVHKCRESIAKDICLMGNIDPLDLMINGSPEDIYKKAEECLSIFSGQHGYILSVGGGLNAGIPAENIQTLVNAAKEFSG